MYYKLVLSRGIQLTPADFGAQIAERVVRRLKEEVEGRLVGRLGYVLLVLNVLESAVSRGLLDDTTGNARFKVQYEAILFRPFRNEVLDSNVDVVTEFGFFASVGPVQVFVHKDSLAEDMSKPQNYNNEESAWISDDGNVTIKAGYGVRLRIVQVNIEADKITAVGTIRGDFLGVVSAG